MRGLGAFRLAIMVIAIAGPAHSAPAAKQAPHGPQVASLRQGFDETLIDYGSARFKDVRLATDGVATCGLVNSKNRMGGYTGWTPFYAMALPSSPAIITLGGDSSSLSVVTAMCGRADLKWLPVDLSDRIAPQP